MNFTIAEVSKPLISVSTWCDQGKRVVFDNSGSYMIDKATGRWEEINRVGNSYDFTTWILTEREEENRIVREDRVKNERNQVGSNRDITKSGFTRLEKNLFWTNQ